MPAWPCFSTTKMAEQAHSQKEFTPVVEFTKAVCQCGRELSELFYQLTTEKHFRKFATTFGLDEKEIANMKFISPTDQSMILDRLSFCCKLTLRFGIREPVSLIQPSEQEARKYPEGLPMPLSREKTLSWY